MKLKTLPLYKQIMKRFFFLLFISTVLTLCLSPSAGNQELLHYHPKHFIWAWVENDRFREQDLFPYLSRQRLVILLEQSNDFRGAAIQAFMKNLPAGFPEVETFHPITPPERDLEDMKNPASRRFSAYLVTFKELLLAEEFLQVLNDLARTPEFDFVLPVFLFPEKMVYPFIQFEVEFLPLELIPGSAEQIKKINEDHFVTEIQQTNTVKNRVILELKKSAPTNILVTVFRYQQMPWIVKNAQLRWLRLRLPVEVQTKWETPMGVNTLNIWEPLRYTLRIERDQGVEILSEAFTEEAVYSWISESTRLPEELIKIDHIDKKTQDLGDGRILDEVVFTLRLSKTGSYLFPQYPLQISYQELNGQKRVRSVQGETPSIVTISDNLPIWFDRIPGRLIPLPEFKVPAWIVSGGMAAGVFLIIVGILGTFKASRRLIGFTELKKQQYDSRKRAQEAFIQKYQGRLKEARGVLETLVFQDDTKQEKEWLRSLSIFLKQLMGEQYYQDENLFLGGLGASSASIKRYLQANSLQQDQGDALNPDKDPIVTILELLQILEQLTLKKSLTLSKKEAAEIFARVERVTESILSGSSNKVSSSSQIG